MMLTNIMRPGNLEKIVLAEYTQLSRSRLPDFFSKRFVVGYGPKSRLPCMGLGAVLALMFLAGCGPPGPRALHRGDRLIQEGQYEEAIDPLKDAVINLSHLPLVQARAYNLLGVAEQGAGHLQPAWQAYQQALKLDRNLAIVDYNLGCLALQQGDFPAAISSLTTFITLHPRDADGYARLGDAYLHYSLQVSPRERARQFENAWNSYNAAGKDFTVVRGRSMRWGWPNWNAARVRRRRNPVKYAVRAFQTALERSSSYPLAAAQPGNC